MPELPEVETIKNVLSKNLHNRTIEWIRLDYKPLLEKTSAYDIQALSGKTFTGFSRRGKYLIFELEDLFWVVHLRMEGKFHLYVEETEADKHTHLMLKVEDQYVHYLDTRKFSRMAVVKDIDAYFITKKLGFEPFDENLTGKFLYDRFKNRKRAIKSVLLDQSIITGIGNIYADEILFATNLHPETPANKVTKKECNLIVQNTREVLQKAIAEGGTTIRSYTSSLGVTGLFQVTLKAYGRANQPCTVCNTTMTRIVVGGRGTVFCKKCQKERL